MFAITAQKGFQVSFENGWTVSVQFGRGNYCQNYNHDNYDGPVPPSRTAEVAAWDKDDNWHDFGGDTVEGHMKPNQVLEFMNEIAAK